MARSVLLAALLLVPAGARPQQLPWQVPTAGVTAAKDPVQYEYPEQVQLTVGKAAEVELHFRVREGLHINSHAPHDASLIRTELIVAEPTGIDVQAVIFPQGTDYASQAFPGHKLSVYTGPLVLRARLVAARPGEQMLSAALRYQACDANTCFPPKQAPITLDLVSR